MLPALTTVAATGLMYADCAGDRAVELIVVTDQPQATASTAVAVGSRDAAALPLLAAPLARWLPMVLPVNTCRLVGKRGAGGEQNTVSACGGGIQ